MTYMKDVASRAYVHNLEGTLENEIELPGLGSVSGFGGNMDDKFVFYNYTLLHVSNDYLPIQHFGATERGVSRAGDPGTRHESVRDQTGLRDEQGRREGADVPRAQEGA